MSGEVTLKNNGAGWHSAAAVGLTIAAVGLCGGLAHGYWNVENRWAGSIVAAVVAYVLWRMLYPAIARLLPQREAVQTVAWTLTEDTLTIGGDVIPRSAIRQVHCWPNRDALGSALAGWTVNIETSGKNRVLRSVTEGDRANASARQLRELVEALGYGRRWDEAAQ
jgi:hypothetical protein